ncbi:hypothetical protein E0K83_05620 [Gramella sp. BOM4]|nr:hypothetical protein [Christiangramia bathymodioli]
MKLKHVTLLIFSILMYSCQQDPTPGTQETELQHQELSLKFDIPKTETTETIGKSPLRDGVIEEKYVASEALTVLNEKLKDQGIAILKVEAMSESSPIILFDKQLSIVRPSSSWVANDPRRSGTTNITYNVFPAFAVANPGIPTESITDAAFDDWENSSGCGGAQLVKQANPGIFNSAILSIGGVGGTPYSDINILGHVPPFVFELVGLGPNTLGVAFTISFRDENGQLTDIDNDNKADTALKEVWYNDGYEWTDDPENNPDAIDLASVITHEIGHTLEAGHFGTGIFNEKKRTISYSPRAVMNALYFEANSDLQTTDRASYCNTFSNW